MIYISGPMTGLPNYNREAFESAYITLTLHGKHKVMNPAKVNLGEKATWEQYMKVAICMLMQCDAILMLDGWETSEGAKIEQGLAESLGYRIYYDIEEIEK